MKRRDPLPLAHVLEDYRPSPAYHAAGSDHPGGTASTGPASVPVPRSPASAGIEKRIHTRFDKAFLVMVGSELYGDTFAVARNVSAGGILVEMSYAPPLGTIVTVHFQHAREGDELDEIVARAEVKHHHYLNFTGGNDAASSRAIGMRFVDFLDPAEQLAPERWH